MYVNDVEAIRAENTSLYDIFILYLGVIMAADNRAIQVTEENLGFIIAFAKAFELNLDYIGDNMKYNAEVYGETTYVIFSRRPLSRVATFTDMTSSGFFQSWKFVSKTPTPYYWNDLEYVGPRRP